METETTLLQLKTDEAIKYHGEIAYGKILLIHIKNHIWTWYDQEVRKGQYAHGQIAMFTAWHDADNVLQNINNS